MTVSSGQKAVSGKKTESNAMSNRSLFFTAQTE